MMRMDPNQVSAQSISCLLKPIAECDIESDTDSDNKSTPSVESTPRVPGYSTESAADQPKDTERETGESGSNFQNNKAKAMGDAETGENNFLQVRLAAAAYRRQISKRPMGDSEDEVINRKVHFCGDTELVSLDVDHIDDGNGPASPKVCFSSILYI